MVLVEIYSKDECHLCDRAKETLLKLQKRHPFEFREIKIYEGTEIFDSMKDRIPVIHINGEFAFQFRVREEEFISKLESAAASRDPSEGR